MKNLLLPLLLALSFSASAVELPPAPQPVVYEDWTGNNLAGKSFSNQTLKNIDCSGCILTSTSFAGANLVNVKFDNAVINSTNFGGARLINVSFVKSVSNGLVNLNGAYLKQVTMTSSVIKKLILTRAAIFDSAFTDMTTLFVADGAVIHDTVFTKNVFNKGAAIGARIDFTKFVNCDLTLFSFKSAQSVSLQLLKSNISGVTMPDVNPYGTIKTGSFGVTK